MKSISQLFQVVAILGPLLLLFCFKKIKRSLKWVDDVLEAVAALFVIRHFWPAKKKRMREARGPLGDVAAIVGLVVCVPMFWFGGLVPWKLIAVAYSAWWFNRLNRRRTDKLDGEDDTELGHRRAAERQAVSRAITAALQQLFAPAPLATGSMRPQLATPLTVTATGRVTVNQGGQVREVGYWVDVKTSGRVTVNSMRAKAGQIFARGDDQIAGTVNEILPAMWTVKKLGPVPQFIASNVEIAARRDGQEIPGRARVSVLLQDPFAVPHPVPYTVGQRYVRAITKGVPVGVRVGGSEVLLEVWSRHTSVQGQSRWGKSQLLHATLYGLATEPHTAFLLADLKGTDLGNWAERASVFVHTPQDTAVMLDKVIAELNRRTQVLRRKGTEKVLRPTAELPWLLVMIDEAQDLVEGGRVTAEEAAANEARLKTIAKKGAALGITLIISSQFVKAKLLDTDVTSQMNQLSAKQPTLSSAGVAIGQHRATKEFGPHKIPGDRSRYAGVIAGSFADSTSDEYARIFHIAGNGKLARARARRCRSRRVELDWLDPEPALFEPATASSPAVPSSATWHGFRVQPIRIADLPDTVVERLQVLADLIELEGLPAGDITPRELRARVINPAVNRAHNDPALVSDRPLVVRCRDEVDDFITDGVVPDPLDEGN